MTEYAFPRDLLNAIKTRWQTTAEQQFELPEDPILQKLPDTCYHASFRTSELGTGFSTKSRDVAALESDSP